MEKQSWLIRRHEISWRVLAPCAFAYALLPIALFLLFWVRPYIGIPLTVLLLLAGLFAVSPRCVNRFPWAEAVGRKKHEFIKDPLRGKSDAGNQKMEALLSGRVILILAGVALLWCILGGQGGLWAQAPDWSARNAVFHDLITYSWPVYYDNETTMLVYYINHWLPAAALAHALYIITGNISLCWMLGNALLLIWTTMGVFLVELLVTCLLRSVSAKQVAFAVCLLVLFSGMDVVGLFSRAAIGFYDLNETIFNKDSLLYLHLEWWTGGGVYQFSSNTTLLFWVFNQSIVPWICLCSLMLQRNLSSYLLILVCCFATGPFACIGLAIIALALFTVSCVRMNKKGELHIAIRSILSPVNIASLPIGFVYACYFLVNQSVVSTGERMQVFGLVPGTSIVLVAVFIFLEAGMLLILVYKEYCRNPLYWVVGIMLLIVPFIHFGSMYEVCCRVSIPALFCLMLMCGRFLQAKRIDMSARPLRSNLSAGCLVVCLLVGSATPVLEITRGVIKVAENGVGYELASSSSFAGSSVSTGEAHNFKAIVNVDSVFFKYLAND